MSGSEAKPPLIQRLTDAITGGGDAEREIFLCTGPDCCRREEGLAAWKHLKHTLKEKGLTKRVAARRTSCMNVCGEGPIAVVYPERVFYMKMNAKGLDDIVETEFVQGRRDARHAFEPPDDVREPPHRTHK